MLAAASGAVAVAGRAGALSTDGLMSLPVACSAGALVSGSIAASFSASVAVAPEAGAMAAESEVGVASIVVAIESLLFRAISSGVAGAAATGSATCDSDGTAVASWFASAVAGASVAIAPAQATDDNPRIAGDISSKFQKVLFMFLTPSH